MRDILLHSPNGGRQRAGKDSRKRVEQLQRAKPTSMGVGGTAKVHCCVERALAQATSGW